MVELDPLGVVRVLWDPEIPLKFQLDTLQFMASAPDYSGDPEELVEEWFAEASEEDTQCVLWALLAWDHLKTAPTFVRERVIREVRELRRAEDFGEQVEF